MKVTTARQIAERVAKLASLSASFAAHYGCDYPVKENSPADVWQVYSEIMNEQAHIARMLNPKALEGAYSRFGKWWERTDVIPVHIVNQMAQEIFALIGRCAFAEDPATGNVDLHHTLVLEQSIAGMLHPSARQTAVEHGTGEIREVI